MLPRIWRFTVDQPPQCLVHAVQRVCLTDASSRDAPSEALPTVPSGRLPATRTGRFWHCGKLASRIASAPVAVRRKAGPAVEWRSCRSLKSERERETVLCRPAGKLDL